MYLREVKKIIIVFFLSGFICGIIYLNLFAKNTVIQLGMFNEIFVKGYSVNKIHTPSFILYIIKCRITPVVVLTIIAITKYKRLVALFVLVWTGFQCGVLLTSGILGLGSKGLVLCLMGLFPHYICYVVIYVMLMIYLLMYPGVRWNYMKTFMLILFLLLGVITECYINPVLMDMVITLLW